MSDEVIRDLLARVKRLEQTAVRHRVGEVTGVGIGAAATPSVDVALGGSDVPYEDVKAVGSMAVGEKVSALLFGNDLLALGPIGPGLRPGIICSGTTQSIPNGFAGTDLGFAHRVDLTAVAGKTGQITGDLANNRLTIAEPGWYLAGAQVRWNNNASGDRQHLIGVNNAYGLPGALATGSGVNPTPSFNVLGLGYLSVGDYLHLAVAQTSGGALAFNAGPVLWAIKVA